MPVQYNRSNPAITRFNATTQTFDQNRRLDEQQFEQRRQREQAMGVDRAMREGIGAIYAQPQQPGAPVQKPPAMVTPPVPVIPPQTESAVLQAQGGDEPAAPMPQPAAPGGELAMPQAPAPMPQALAPGGAAPMPSPSAAPRPAIANVQAGGSVNPTSVQNPASVNPLMARLAQTPGAGAAMMQEHGREQTRQTQRGTAERLVGTQKLAAQNQGWNHLNKALDDFDVDRAQQISTQYELGIPDQAWTNMKFRSSMLLGSKLAKDMFNLQDEHRPQFLHAFMQNIGAGMDEHTSAVEAYSTVSKPGTDQPPGTTGAKKLVKNSSGQYVWVYQGGGSTPTNVRGSVPGARGGGGGAGGAGGKQQQYAQWRINTLKAAGLPEAEAAKIVAGGSKQVTERDVTNLGARLLNTKDRVGRPLYGSLQEATDAARGAYGIEGAPADSGGGAPAPTRSPRRAPTSGSQAPAPRRFDAEGNEIRQ